MRYPFLAALALGPAAGLFMGNAGVFSATSTSTSPAVAPLARACDSKCSSAWMDANLRLNQLQIVGTGASYKQRPESGVLAIIRMGGREDAEALDFGQPPLTAQLDADVRALAFDIVHDPKGGAFRNPAIAGMGMALLSDDFRATMQKPRLFVWLTYPVDVVSVQLILIVWLYRRTTFLRLEIDHLTLLLPKRGTAYRNT